jgi:hypothetical protein
MYCTFTPSIWIALLGLDALTMNSGPMQVLGQQYFAWGSISLDDAAAARYNLEGALCTARLETCRSVSDISEELKNKTHY